MNSKIVFLTNSFYQDHPNPPFKEMEQKQNRPYIVFLVEIEGHTWAIPFRSHIRHRHAFFTDAKNKCGIDYSKAVVVDKPEYIDQQVRPHLRRTNMKLFAEMNSQFKRDLKNISSFTSGLFDRDIRAINRLSSILRCRIMICSQVGA